MHQDSESAQYLVLVTLGTEAGELPATLDEVADLIAAQMGDDYLTEPPPFGTGLQHFATEVVAVSGTGFDFVGDNDGELYKGYDQ